MSKQPKDGGPAFPCNAHIPEEYAGKDPEGHDLWIIAHTKIANGLSMRDWFAGMALQGLIACGQLKYCQEVQEHLATIAYFQADEMLKAREQ